MSRTHRLFEITQYLRNRKLTTAQQLAEWLEVSPRTIYRDIQQLMLSGVPINGEAGVGYWLEDGFDFPPIMFNQEELEALHIGMQLAINCTDPRLAIAARNVLDKVQAQLPPRLAQGLKQTPMTMHFPLYPEDIRRRMELMRKAIKSQHKLLINYVDEKSDSSQRIVRPLELSFWGKSWTLASWCELRHDFRNFRPDRIVNVHRSEQQFIAEPGKTLQDFYQAMSGQKHS